MTGDSLYLYDLAVLVLNELADTGTKELCADESGDTADHVDSAGTCKIVEAHLSQPAAAPDPVSLNGIDKSGDNARIDAVRKELCSFCHSSRNDGSCCCAEHKVEYEA